MKQLFTFFTFLIFGFFHAQELPEVKTKSDTTEIKIGEQIQYEISVKTPQETSVVFPEKSAFLPMEVVFEEKTDTLTEGENWILKKLYHLTQFNQGNYAIAQKIQIGNEFFTTDSLKIQVQSVALDTSKPLEELTLNPIFHLEIPQKFNWNWIIFALVFLIISAAVYWFFFRKKPLTEQEKFELLSPFDKAIFKLKGLQNSKLILESRHKEYYSHLTDIVRQYLEEEVKISATESTTDELIAKIELLLDSKFLTLPTDIITEFKSLLKKSDLVKFAKFRPETRETETDLQSIESVLTHIKNALPEPSEEENLKNQIFLQQLQEKKRKIFRKKATIFAVVFLFLAMIFSGGYTYYYTKFIQNTSKEYSKITNWITSIYGNPPLKITTPVVLQRQDKNNIPIAKNVFSFGNLNDGLTMHLVSFEFPSSESVSQQSEQVKKLLEKVIDLRHKASNILSEASPYTSSQGIEGVRVTGSFEREINQKRQKIFYQNYLFTNNQNAVVLIFEYPERYKEADQELIERIIFSLNFVR